MPEVAFKAIPFRMTNVNRRLAPKKWLVSFALCTTLLYDSCKKVDANKELLTQLPTLVTSGPLAYHRSYLVGDTMTVTGKLFIDQGESRVKIGMVDATILKMGKVQMENQAAGVGTYTLDQIKLVITGNMSQGNSIPVTVFANGHLINGPSISINKLSANSGKTDTTLVVNEIVSWSPDNYLPYKGQDLYGSPVLLPLISGGSVDKNGQVYFYNPVEVLKVSGPVATEQIVKAGNNLGDGTDSFKIKFINGSTVDFEGKYLYISAEVTDTAKERDLFNVYRLLRIDLSSNTVTTLNRSVLSKDDPYGTNIMYTGPSEGDIKKLNVSAFYLKSDLNGNLYFLNLFALDGGNYNQICRLDDKANVKSLFSGINNSQPGIKINLAGNYAMDAAGHYLFVDESADGPTLLYNAAEDEIVADLQVPPQFMYRSFDKDSLSAPNTNSIFLGNFQYLAAQLAPPAEQNRIGYSGYISNRMLLASGELLLTQNIVNPGGEPQSILSLNLNNNTAYTYAGAENNFANQNKETGPVKYVDFFGIGFLGQDKLNNIYFFKTAISSDGNSYGKVRIYALKKP